MEVTILFQMWVIPFYLFDFLRLKWIFDTTIDCNQEKENKCKGRDGSRGHKPVAIKIRWHFNFQQHLIPVEATYLKRKRRSRVIVRCARSHPINYSNLFHFTFVCNERRRPNQTPRKKQKQFLERKRKSHELNTISIKIVLREILQSATHSHTHSVKQNCVSGR